MKMAGRAGARPRLLLSLSGSGHLLTYQLGAVRELLASPAWGGHVVALAGTSGGAIIAAAAAALLPRGPSNGAAWEAFLHVACRGGAFAHLARALGPTAAASASGALLLGATACGSGRAATFGRYRSADELLACVLASAAVPASAHPLDLLLARGRPLRYPDREGVLVPPACEWRAARTGGAEAETDSDAEDEDEEGQPYVDGGLSSGLPLLPQGALEALSVDVVITVSPFAGPRGTSAACGRLPLLPPSAAEALRADEEGERHAPPPLLARVPRFHVCPEDGASWLRLPLPPARLGGGLACAWTAVNGRAALAAALGAPVAELAGWHERGRADAQHLLVGRGPPRLALGLPPPAPPLLHDSPSYPPQE